MGATQPADNPAVREPRPPTFAEAFRFWVKLGFISFGGPAGQIAIMHTELVEQKRWISNARFLHALNFCMLLPGPEAQQLAIYIGWLLHRTWGGLVAGFFFVLPAAIILWALSLVYVLYGRLPEVAAIFYGLKPAVVAIVAAAMVRLGRNVLKNSVLWLLAGLAFVAIFFFHTPFPAIVVAAGLLGLAGGRWRPAYFRTSSAHGGATDEPALSESTLSSHDQQSSWRRLLRVAVLGLLIWWLPVAGAALWLGAEHVIVREGLFFSRAAMVTFGGAYAVLPYVAEHAVKSHQWLSAGEMLDGLGLAETTPGPLIMVLQFVGFLGAWHQPGALPPWGAATLGALMTTWTTFVPCFLWIFLGAPHIEQLRGKTSLTAALSAVTAAVVGVMLNLTVWFGRNVFLPAGQGLDMFALLLSAVVFFGLVRWKWSIAPVVLAAGIVGLVWKLVLAP